jgi:hypothetical protein
MGHIAPYSIRHHALFGELIIPGVNIINVTDTPLVACLSLIADGSSDTAYVYAMGSAMLYHCT